MTRKINLRLIIGILTIIAGAILYVLSLLKS